MNNYATRLSAACLVAVLTGRFGIFVPGTVRAECYDAAGSQLKTLDVSLPALPRTPLVIDTVVEAPAAAASVRLVLFDRRGEPVGELAQADVQEGEAAMRWPASRAWAWYKEQMDDWYKRIFQ